MPSTTNANQDKLGEVSTNLGWDCPHREPAEGSTIHGEPQPWGSCTPTRLCKVSYAQEPLAPREDAHDSCVQGALFLKSILQVSFSLSF